MENLATMSISTYFFRLEQMDGLIRRHATGTPSEFASRVGISRAMLYKYLDVMKELGGPIAYSSQRQSYYYSKNVHLKIKYE